LSGGKIFHLTAHMLPLYLVKHNALFCTNYTAYLKKCAISRQSSASSTRPVAAKQPGPAAWLVFSSSRHKHINPLFHQRHWLKVAEQIDY